jgi:hypothetical protein
MGMAKESFFEMAREEVKNTIVSYFSPVRAVISEMSKAVAAEAPLGDRASPLAADKKPTAC